LKASIEVVETRCKIHTTSRTWGVLATSLCNHLYGFTQSRKRGKARVLHKVKKHELIFYVKKMQVIGHSPTLTQLKLKVAKIT
jgi:hypothetical protein